MKTDLVGPTDFEIVIKVHVREDREVIVTPHYPDNWRVDPRFEKVVGEAIHLAHDNYRTIVMQK